MNQWAQSEIRGAWWSTKRLFSAESLFRSRGLLSGPLLRPAPRAGWPASRSRDRLPLSPPFYWPALDAKPFIRYESLSQPCPCGTEPIIEAGEDQRPTDQPSFSRLPGQPRLEVSEENPLLVAVHVISAQSQGCSIYKERVIVIWHN